MNDSSAIDIREAIEKRYEAQELQSINETKRENEIDLIHAIEDLDSILEYMVLRKQKKSSTKVNRRFKCRALIVSLAIKRGFNAELSKDSEYVIIDCY
jgi:cellulose biosynthesis protein BcsQ